MHQIITIMIDQTSNNYTPTPVDTTNIQLPEELMALAEAISKNVHEVWAQNRMNEGNRIVFLCSILSRIA